MATQVTPSMRTHAESLLARSSSWARGTRNRDGLAFYLFNSSRTSSDGQPVLYMTRADGVACTCPGNRHRGVCCHAVAVRMAAERDQERQERAATTWRPCSRSCGTLLPPEHLAPLCGYCWEQAKRLLAND